MIQAAMYFALGVLTAGLLVLLVMPAIWRRTARLTRQRIEATVPTTLAEIEADKDQLRAEFAMNVRRLEMTVDRLRDKTTEQIIEINEQRAEIVRLTNDRNDKTKTIEGLEGRAARLVADLAAADERLARASERIAQRDATIELRDAEVAELRTELAAAQQLSDEQKLEIVARNTEIGNLNDRLVDAKATEDAIAGERDRLAGLLAAEQAALAAERRRVANLEASIARIEAERIDRLAELERRAAEARDLLAELVGHRTRADDLAAKVAELEVERAARNTEFERRVAEIRARHATQAAFSANGTSTEEADLADGDNIAKAIAAAEAENAELSARLADLESEHASLRAEYDDLRRVASDDWQVETENAILRERLAGVAADVIRLTGSIADSKPAASYAAERGNGGGSGNGHGAEAGPHRAAASSTAYPVAIGNSPQPVEGKTLAERLRALQQATVRH